MLINDDVELEISFVKEEELVYIGTPNFSGAKYKCKTIDDLKKSIETYIESYIDYEKIPSYDEQEIDK